MSRRRLPAEIYWRRRLLVLAVVIGLVWVGLRVFGDEAEPDRPVATPTATTPATTPVAALVNGKVKVTLETGTAQCDPEKVRVSPAVKGGQHVGGRVKVAMSVSTTEKKPCVVNPKTADLLVVISANKAPVWDSDVCKTALLSKPVAVSPPWTTVVETTWSGRGSGPNCSPDQGYASPGTYVIKSATLGGEPGQATFRLTNKPKPKPAEKTEEPDKKKDEKSD